MKKIYGRKYFKEQERKTAIHDDIYAHVVAGIVTFIISIGIVVLHTLLKGG